MGAIVTTAYRFPGTVTSSPGGAPDWTPAGASLVADLGADDGSYVSWNRGSFPDTSDDLIETNWDFASVIPANAKRIVAIERKVQGGTGTSMDPSVWHSQLTYDASTKVGTDPAPAFSGAVESAERTIGDTTSYLYGATPTVAQVRSTNFGVIDWFTNSDASHNVRLDYSKMRITYEEGDPPGEEEEETMDLYHAGAKGGLSCLGFEALPACSSSTAIFANAPEGTIFVEFVFHTQAVWIKWNGGTANNAEGSGIKYNIDTVYRRPLTRAQGDTVTAKQDAATAVGTISYWGKV